MLYIIGGLVSLVMLSLILVFSFIDTVRYFYLGEIPEYVTKTNKGTVFIMKSLSNLKSNIFSQYLMNQEKIILYSTEISIGLFSLFVLLFA